MRANTTYQSTSSRYINFKTTYKKHTNVAPGSEPWRRSAQKSERRQHPAGALRMQWASKDGIWGVGAGGLQQGRGGVAAAEGA